MISDIRRVSARSFTLSKATYAVRLVPPSPSKMAAHVVARVYWPPATEPVFTSGEEMFLALSCRMAEAGPSIACLGDRSIECYHAAFAPPNPRAPVQSEIGDFCALRLAAATFFGAFSGAMAGINSQVPSQTLPENLSAQIKPPSTWLAAGSIVITPRQRLYTLQSGVGAACTFRPSAHADRRSADKFQHGDPGGRAFRQCWP